MDQDLKMREQLSAMADGALAADEWAQALQHAATPGGRQAWHEFHLVGDALRSNELVQGAHQDAAFLARLHARLEAEPGSPRSALQPAPAQVLAVRRQAAANQELFRWKMLAGLASVAAVSVVGWSVLDATRSPGAGVQMAATPNPQATSSVQVAAQPSADTAVMLRDPRLDELLAARRQYSGANSLQMPARFLRNTHLEEAQR